MPKQPPSWAPPSLGTLFYHPINLTLLPTTLRLAPGLGPRGSGLRHPLPAGVGGEWNQPWLHTLHPGPRMHKGPRSHQICKAQGKGHLPGLGSEPRAPARRGLEQPTRFCAWGCLLLCPPLARCRRRRPASRPPWHAGERSQLLPLVDERVFALVFLPSEVLPCASDSEGAKLPLCGAGDGE